MYKDCSVYYGDITKLGELIGCYVYNANIWWRDLWGINPADLNRTMKQFYAWGDTHLGFIAQFTKLLVGSQNLFTTSRNIVCLHNFGTFFGQPFVFNQCQLEETNPQAWGVVSMILRATMVFAVVLMAYRTLRISIRDRSAPSGGSD